MIGRTREMNNAGAGMKKSILFLLLISLLITACGDRQFVEEPEQSGEITSSTATTIPTESTTQVPATESEPEIEYDYDTTQMELWWHDFPDGAELEKMTNLTSVYLELEGLDSDDGNDYEPYISALTALPGLNTLTIHANFFVDEIEVIDRLNNLTTLNIINRHGFQNPQGFAGFISPAAQLDNLTSLCIYDRYSYMDLALLENFTNLTQLDIQTQYGGIANIKSVAKLTNLTSLRLVAYTYSEPDCPRSADIAALTALPNLTRLELYGEISDLSALGKFVGLTYLSVGNWYIETGEEYVGAPITDITPLMGLTNLTELRIEGALVDDADLDKLREALPNCTIVYNEWNFY